MRRWLRLGLRLSVGAGRAGVVRTLLMASGATIGTVVLLAALAGMAVIDRQGDTSYARTPRYGERASAGATLTFASTLDSVGGRRLRRVAVAGATADSPLAPGVAAYPRPGEAVVSPALAELIRTDERAAARFPQRIVGLIGEAGLLAPDELCAFVGVPSDDPYLADRGTVVGFGTPQRPGYFGGHVMDWFTPERGVAIVFIVLVLVPFGVFLATCARLSASTRDRRIAALRLLGVSARQAALVNTVETGVVAGAGALIGYGLFRALVPLSQSWHLGRLHWYARDLVLPVPVVALVLLGTVTFAVAIGVLATRPARVAPLRVRRDAPARRPRLWRLGVLAAGLALLTVAFRNTAQDPPAVFLAYGGGVVLVGLGLPLMVPLLSWAAAGLLRRLPAPVSWQLATARLRHAPSVAPRLAAALTAVVFVTGVALLGLTLVTPHLDASNRKAGQVPAWTTIIEPGLAEEIADLGGRVARRTWLSADAAGTDIGITVADCASLLVEFTLPPNESCVDGGGYRIATGDQAIPEAGAKVRVSEEGWGFAAPVPVLHPAAAVESASIGSILLTPSAAQLGDHAPSRPTWSTIYLPDDDHLERLAQLISARTPANNLQSRLHGAHGVDEDLLATLAVTLLVATTGLGVAAFAVAAVDRTVERRRESATLALVGTPGRLIATSEVIAAALPLAVGIGLAVAASIAITGTTAQLVGSKLGAAMEVVRPALWLGGVALLAGLALVTIPALVPRRITAASLRRP